MSLADFEFAEVQEGHLYELGRGVIVVSDVANLAHLVQVMTIRDQLVGYRLQQPGRMFGVLSRAECKLLVADFESERHPDLAVFLTPPGRADSHVWRTWIPEIAIEVVSPGSKARDYDEKREEYLALGVKEYWTFDASRGEMLALRRRAGRWTSRVIRPPKSYTTRLLPGFELACGPVFDAVRAIEG